jgi:hypothetical protein
MKTRSFINGLIKDLETYSDVDVNLLLKYYSIPTTLDKDLQLQLISERLYRGYVEADMPASSTCLEKLSNVEEKIKQYRVKLSTDQITAEDCLRELEKCEDCLLTDEQVQLLEDIQRELGLAEMDEAETLEPVSESRPESRPESRSESVAVIESDFVEDLQNVKRRPEFDSLPPIENDYWSTADVDAFWTTIPSGTVVQEGSTEDLQQPDSDSGESKSDDVQQFLQTLPDVTSPVADQATEQASVPAEPKSDDVQQFLQTLPDVTSPVADQATEPASVPAESESDVQQFLQTLPDVSPSASASELDPLRQSSDDLYSFLQTLPDVNMEASEIECQSDADCEALQRTGQLSGLHPTQKVICVKKRDGKHSCAYKA